MTKINSNKLNDQFGITDTVIFNQGPGELPFVHITNAAASATVSLYGGQVISFKPRIQNSVLWKSDHCYYEVGKAIRGGIPICWPWFGAHPTDPTKPAHGFARTSEWNVISTDPIDNEHTQIRLALANTKLTQELWPHQFHLEIVVLVGKHLTVDLIVRNTGTQLFTYTGALHSYFNVEDVTKIKIHGLDGVSYLDLLDTAKLKQQKGPITINEETDRTYLDTSTTCFIEDPVLNRKIHIAKKGSQSTVIWNPWIAKAERMNDFGNNEYLGMVCVETTNAHTDSITVHPGKEHRLQTAISVIPI